MTNPTDEHEAKCAALYEAGPKTYPVRDGFLVVGRSYCQLCKNSMRNNGYATQTAGGKGITWFDIDQEMAMNAFYAISGMSYDYEKEVPLAAGHPLGGVPFVLYIEGGAVKRDAVKYGEVPPGGFEQLLEGLQ